MAQGQEGLKFLFLFQSVWYLPGGRGWLTAMLTANMKQTVAYGDASTKSTNI